MEERASLPTTMASWLWHATLGALWTWWQRDERRDPDKQVCVPEPLEPAYTWIDTALPVLWTAGGLALQPPASVLDVTAWRSAAFTAGCVVLDAWLPLYAPGPNWVRLWTWGQWALWFGHAYHTGPSWLVWTLWSLWGGYAAAAVEVRRLAAWQVGLVPLLCHVAHVSVPYGVWVVGSACAVPLGAVGWRTWRRWWPVKNANNDDDEETRHIELVSPAASCGC